MTNTYMNHPRTLCAARPCRSPLACEAMDKCREAGADDRSPPPRIDSATALYVHLSGLPSIEHDSEIVEALPSPVNPAWVAALLEDDDPNLTDAERYLDALAGRTIRELMATLDRIIGLAGSCVAQRLPSDDQVISDNIANVLKLAGDAHAGRAS